MTKCQLTFGSVMILLVAFLFFESSSSQDFYPDYPQFNPNTFEESEWRPPRKNTAPAALPRPHLQGLRVSPTPTIGSGPDYPKLDDSEDKLLNNARNSMNLLLSKLKKPLPPSTSQPSKQTNPKTTTPKQPVETKFETEPLELPSPTLAAPISSRVLSAASKPQLFSSSLLASSIKLLEAEKRLLKEKEIRITAALQAEDSQYVWKSAQLNFFKEKRKLEKLKAQLKAVVGNSKIRDIDTALKQVERQKKVVDEKKGVANKSQREYQAKENRRRTENKRYDAVLEKWKKAVSSRTREWKKKMSEVQNQLAAFQPTETTTSTPSIPPRSDAPTKPKISKDDEADDDADEQPSAGDLPTPQENAEDKTEFQQMESSRNQRDSDRREVDDEELQKKPRKRRRTAPRETEQGEFDTKYQEISVSVEHNQKDDEDLGNPFQLGD